MINKIKDFLKNTFRRKGTSDSSDQSDFDDLETGASDDDFGPPEPKFDRLSDDNFGPPNPQFERDVNAEFGLTNPKFDPMVELSSDETADEEIPDSPSQNDPDADVFFGSDDLTEEPVLEEPSEDNATYTPEPVVSSSVPDRTAAFDFSQAKARLDSDFPIRQLSAKEKIGAFFSRMKFRLGSTNMRKMKLPDFSKIGADGGPVLSPSLSKSIDKFLSRESRENIHQITIIFLICGITYTLGKISALVVRGAPVLETAKNFSVEIPIDRDFNPMALNQVKAINIFRTGTGSKSDKKVADTKCEEAQQASSLPIKLINTIVLQDTVKSLAAVQVRGGRDLQEVREGDQIDNLARIFRITRLEILVKNLENGVCESIASDTQEEATSPISVMTPSESKNYKANKKMNGIENVGNKFMISRALLDEKMKDIGSILTQAKAIRIQNPDGTLAFKMTEMDPNGIFSYLGLQDQDIITSIDGKPIYDMNEVMSKFAKIKNLDKLQLGIKREGSDSMQDYSIKK